MDHPQIIETPSPDLLKRVALFAQQHAGWHTTPFDVSLVNGFFAVIYGPQNTLVATGSVSFFSTAWLGNVIVAKTHRRKGIATAIVRALQREALSRRPDMDLCLIASLLGQFVYPKLGFHTVDEVALCQLDPCPPPPPSSLRAVFPTDEQHEAAITFYEQSVGYSRRNELQAIFTESRQCAVLILGGNVVAAAWARFTSADGSTGTFEANSGVFLGPVVAKYPDYAISVCSQLLRMKKNEGEHPNCSRGILALVQQSKGDDRQLNVFKSLGFVAHYQLQYMVKSSNTARNVLSTKYAFSSQAPQYFALMGFDLG